MAGKPKDISEELIASLREAAAIMRGDAKPARVHLPPGLRCARDPDADGSDATHFRGTLRTGARGGAGLGAGPPPARSGRARAADGDRTQSGRGGGGGCRRAGGVGSELPNTVALGSLPTKRGTPRHPKKMEIDNQRTNIYCLTVIY